MSIFVFVQKKQLDSWGIVVLNRSKKQLLSSFFLGKTCLLFFQLDLEKLCATRVCHVFNAVLGTDRSIVVVVSPLVSIMKDQVRKLILSDTFNKKGLASAYMSVQTKVIKLS